MACECVVYSPLEFSRGALVVLDRRGPISVNQPRVKTFAFKAKAGLSLQSDFVLIVSRSRVCEC
jgi:hypothetical protein